MKTFFQMLLLLVIMSFLSGCTHNSTKQDYTADWEDQPSEYLEGSLFKEDQTVLSNKEIEIILASKVKLHTNPKMAILHLRPTGRWSRWSEESAKLHEQIVTNIIMKLKSCKHLDKVSILPALLIPKKMGFPHLREAAARFQADLLLVYRARSQTYQRSKLFKKDQTKAYCTIEAILLDTRTGIVPFSSVATKSYSTEKSRKDINFSETILRAKQHALAKALEGIADDLIKFLNQCDKQRPSTQPGRD